MSVHLSRCSTEASCIWLNSVRYAECCTVCRDAQKLRDVPTERDPRSFGVLIHKIHSHMCNFPTRVGKARKDCHREVSSVEAAKQTYFVPLNNVVDKRAICKSTKHTLYFFRRTYRIWSRTMTHPALVLKIFFCTLQVCAADCQGTGTSLRTWLTIVPMHLSPRIYVVRFHHFTRIGIQQPAMQCFVSFSEHKHFLITGLP